MAGGHTDNFVHKSINTFWGGVHYHKVLCNIQSRSWTGRHLFYKDSLIHISVSLKIWNTLDFFNKNLFHWTSFTSVPTALTQFSPSSFLLCSWNDQFQLITLLFYICLLFYSFEITLKLLSHFKFTATCEEGQMCIFPFAR